MGSPSRSMLSFAMGAISALLACGRSTSSPDAGGSIIATGGMSGATSPVDGTPTGGVAEAGGGLGRGGMSATGDGMDAGESTPTGGTISGAGGTTVTSSTLVAGTGGTMARGGSHGLGGAVSDGGVVASGGNLGTGGSAGVGGGVALPPKFFGNIDTRGSIRSDFTTYWDQFTPENAGKWSSVQSSSGTFKWTSLDTMYQYCEEKSIVFKEQSFIWGSAQPNWINNSNAAEVARNWMKAFCDRYPKTRIIDVVNEPLHMVPTYKEGLGGAGTSGWDWIVNSFKWAQEACPNAILVLNDYNIIEYSSDHDKVIALIKGSLAAGAPIMAIGAESHDLTKVSLSTVQTYLADLISQTGLPVYITEMDLGIADDAQQAALMKDLVTTFWNDPNVPGITYWGYIAGATWRPNTELITSSGTMRPAMTWLMDFLHR